MLPFARNIEKQPSDSSAPASTRAARGWFGRIALCAVVAGLGWGGYTGYMRYFGGNAVCLLPPVTAGGPTITVGTETIPETVVYGHVAMLEQQSNPIRFRVLPTEIEIRDVHYKGTVVDQSAIPSSGALRIVKVAGKSIALRDTAIHDGCISLRGLGQSILLFSSSFAPTTTLVLTPDQIAQLR
jgi:hypothetical protein